MDSKLNRFLQNILSDLKVELTDEFDRNFERKAFFDEPWAEAKTPNSRGSLMNRTGDLRKSISSETDSGGIDFSSSLPYADIHNQGGILKVSEAMKKYFWHMYIQHKNDGDIANAYKAMALMKVGAEIKIPKRQFIGPHEQVTKSIQLVVDNNVKDLEKEIFNQLKNIQ